MAGIEQNHRPLSIDPQFRAVAEFKLIGICSRLYKMNNQVFNGWGTTVMINYSMSNALWNFHEKKILFIKKQRKNINRLAQTLSPIKYPVETSIKHLVPQRSIWSQIFGFTRIIFRLSFEFSLWFQFTSICHWWWNDDCFIFGEPLVSCDDIS